MTRKGTEGRSPKANIGAHDSAIDKAIKKTKDAFSGDNEQVEYDEVKHKTEAERVDDNDRNGTGEGSRDVSSEERNEDRR